MDNFRDMVMEQWKELDKKRFTNAITEIDPAFILLHLQKSILETRHFSGIIHTEEDLEALTHFCQEPQVNRPVA